MQQKTERRSNKSRTESTRAALLDAGRNLFTEKGFADTGTPEIVKTAGVTRGALYHHFADKEALFRFVVEEESKAVAQDIEAATADTPSPMEGLLTGADAYFDSMRVPGRTRLLLVDGPSVLGDTVMREIDMATGGATLVDGLRAAQESNALKDVPLAETADLLSAAFDRAATAIATGENPERWKKAVTALIDGITTE